MPYRYARRVPTASEHRALAARVGWTDTFSWEAMPASLQNSVCGVVASRGDALVGMGRVIGDGAFYYYLQDIAVRPEDRGRGVGSAIVGDLIEQVREIAPPRAFIGLFGTSDALGLYRRYGFAAHPEMTGMVLALQPDAIPAG